MNIKNLKPKRGGHYKQGYFNVSKSKKYYGDRKCIYRSGLEFQFMVFCESNKNIVKWSSEPFTIPYMLNGKKRNYNIDFVCEYTNGRIELIEVKPFKQVQEAQKFNKEVLQKSYIVNEDGKKVLPTLTFKNEKDKTACINALKWNATKKYCHDMTMKKGIKHSFIIVTEKFRF